MYNKFFVSFVFDNKLLNQNHFRVMNQHFYYRKERGEGVKELW